MLVGWLAGPLGVVVLGVARRGQARAREEDGHYYTTSYQALPTRHRPPSATCSPRPPRSPAPRRYMVLRLGAKEALCEDVLESMVGGGLPPFRLLRLLFGTPAHRGGPRVLESMAGWRPRDGGRCAGLVCSTVPVTPHPSQLEPSGSRRQQAHCRRARAWAQRPRPHAHPASRLPWLFTCPCSPPASCPLAPGCR